MNGERPTGYWWFKQVRVGLSENLVNALKLLANQQKDGDSPIQSTVTGFMKEAEKELWSLRNSIT